MLSYIKRIFTIIMAAVMLAQPFVAQAVNLDSAFNSLLGQGTAVSLNSPGRFQSGSRNTFSAGGFDMRIPRASSSPSVFSFTPPNIAIGCNGISAHFGGLSFISGKEFEQMIKQIGTGVIVGFVVQMAIKVTCPMCEDIINKLRQAAELAAKFAVDGCNAGMAIGAKLADSASKSTLFGASGGDKPQSKAERVKSECGTGSTTVGTSSDLLEALTSNCKDLSTAYDFLISNAKQMAGLSGSDKDSNAAKAVDANVQCTAGYGNLTWASLASLDSDNKDKTAAGNGMIQATFSSSSYERKLLFMNLLGVQVAPTPSTGGQSGKVPSCEDGEGVTRYEGVCAPRLTQDDAKGLMAFIMCGTANLDNLPQYATIQTFCKGYRPEVADSAGQLQQLKVYDCQTSGSAYSKEESIEHCPVVKLNEFKNVFTGMETGYAVKVRRILEYGMTKIINDQSFFTNDALDQQLLQLINMAPFPLYQALNVAAIYPAAVNDLLDMLSLLVAQQLAVSQLEEMLRIHSRTGISKQCFQLSPELVLTTASSTRAYAAQFAAEIAKNYTLQQMIIEQIRTLNLSIQKQVLSADMLNSAKFAQNVTGVMPNVKSN